MISPVVKIKGKVQHYAWGGYEYIPALLGIKNLEKKPFAEYWLGTHELASAVLTSTGSSLLQEINLSPENILGKKVYDQFHRLPFLLKILDVREMLSIQVHPSRKNAVVEFENENKKGIPLAAPHRNYKDDNHKPELMVALSDFWLLHGFKSPEKLRTTLQAVPELKSLLSYFDNDNYKGLYQYVMELPQVQVNEILQPLIDSIIPLYQQNKLDKSSEDFWAARAAITYNQPDITDRGIFSIYFFNLLQVKEGQAIFQDAGLPHAYLEGQNVEIMANSDNVLRGGLTPKHIDVTELLKHIKFEATVPNILNTGNKRETVYKTPAPDFELSRIELKNESMNLISETAEILIVLNGDLSAITENSTENFAKGEAAFIKANTQYTLKTVSSCAVYRAKVPVHIP